VSKSSSDPYGEQDVSRRLDSWAAALEMAVATLNRTLAEVKTYSGKESDERYDGPAQSGEPGGGG
jgi:hypothetical protein